ncbi:single-stranded DNA-binding protein [Luteimonas sp. RIT-PG2_3]
MNNFNAIGRVGKDAVTRFTQGGDPVTGWSLAVDSGYGDKKQTMWIDCSAWGKRFEKVSEYITKGSQLGVTGELGTREHDGKTYITLRVADITLVGGKQEGSKSQRQESKPDKAYDDFRDDEINF